MSSRMSFKNHTKVLPTSMLDLNNRLKVCDSVTHLLQSTSHFVIMTCLFGMFFISLSIILKSITLSLS